MTATLLLVSLILAAAAGTFLGLLLCSSLGLGFGFEDLKIDVAKCVVLAAVVVLQAAGLLALAKNVYVVAPTPVVWWIGIKLCWHDIENPEIFLTGAVALSTTAALGLFAWRILAMIG